MKRTGIMIIILAIFLGATFTSDAASSQIEPEDNYTEILADKPDADIILANGLIMIKSHSNEWIVCGVKIKKMPLWKEFKESTPESVIPIKITYAKGDDCRKHVRFIFADAFHREIFIEIEESE